jgi:hypothetical protein
MRLPVSIFSVKIAVSFEAVSNKKALAQKVPIDYYKISIS